MEDGNPTGQPGFYGYGRSCPKENRYWGIRNIRMGITDNSSPSIGAGIHEVIMRMTCGIDGLTGHIFLMEHK